MSYRFDRLAIHAGQPNDEGTGAVAVPIYQTSTFAQTEPGENRGFSYARTDHPTRKALEENLAAGLRCLGTAFKGGGEPPQSKALRAPSLRCLRADRPPFFVRGEQDRPDAPRRLAVVA